MKKLIFTILFFISVQLQSQNTSNNPKSSYTIDKALKQFVGFCKIQIDTENPSDGNYIQFCITALELKEQDIPNLTKPILKQEVEKVLSDDIIKNKFLKNLAKMGACDEQRIYFLIHPPANDDGYVVKVSVNDAQLLSQYVYSNFCNSSIDSEDVNTVAIQKQQDDGISGHYKIISNKAFFYSEPQEATKKTSYLIKGNEVNIKNSKGKFGYGEYQNTRGMITKGWLKLSDITLTIATTEDVQAVAIAKMQKEEQIKQQKALLEQQRIAELVKKAEIERIAREAEDKLIKEKLKVTSCCMGAGPGGENSNNGINSNTTGRNWVIRKIPFNSTNKKGIVVVEVKVDRDGNIIYAKGGVVGSTATDSYLIKLAEEAALTSKMTAGSKIDDGTIIYNFN